MPHKTNFLAADGTSGDLANAASQRRENAAFLEGKVQRLLDATETFTHTGLHDHALLGVLAYRSARIGAVVNLKVEDYFQNGKRSVLRLSIKGGKEKEFSVNHVLEEILNAYL